MGGDAKHAVPPLALQLFGPLEIRLNGCPLPPPLPQGPLAFRLLTLQAGRPVERSWLAGQLWPDNIESQALANLRTSLNDLR
jgi:DNA-binding SARP family transcriptional activator